MKCPMIDAYDYSDPSDVVPTFYLLLLLERLKVGKFTVDWQEHWTTWTLTIEYRDERHI